MAELKNKCTSRNKSIILFLILAAGFIFRIFISFILKGYVRDIECFDRWGQEIIKFGFRSFYSSSEFIDYPPLYIYVLYILAHIKNLFNIANNSAAFFILMKLPANIADIITSFIIYKKTKSINLTLLYIFNPAVWVDGAWWGQIDSVFVLIVILALMNIEKPKKALIYFTLSVLLKPQGLIFSPVFIMLLIKNYNNEVNLIKNQIKIPKREWNFKTFSAVWLKPFIKAFFLVLPSIVVSLLVIAPFTDNDIFWIFRVYIETLGSYPYATLNFFNLMGFFGGNGIPYEQTMFILSYRTIGFISILAITITSFIMCSKNKNVYFNAAFLIISFCILSAKVHERYLFPAFILLIFAYHEAGNISHTKNKEKYLYTYIAFSLTFFINIFSLLRKIENNIFYFDSKDVFFVAFSLVNVLIFLYFISDIKFGKIDLKGLFNLKLKKIPRLTKPDYIVMLSLTPVYGIVALINLGSMYAPKTYIKADRPIVIEFEKEEYINYIYHFSGLRGEGNVRPKFLLEYDNGQLEFEQDEVFSWYKLSTGIKTKNIKLTPATKGFYTGEIGFYTNDGDISNENRIYPVITEENKNLFDEEIRRKTYLTSTYFDEIYHARTAFEHINNIVPYEYTHPPLGKLIIALGIKLFGMNPFGWRVMGTVLGIIMTPLMYIFGKWIFRKTLYAFLVSFLFTFDFMHFAQTRIATIDVYSVFFVILMYMFMYRYFVEKPKGLSIERNLFLSGLFFGLGVASKWTCIYAGAGLFVIFIFKNISNYLKYKDLKHILRAVLTCLVSFIILPTVIYFLSYYPTIEAENGDLKTVIDYQVRMYDYHSNLKEGHSFSSQWYSWPFNYRPIWYYQGPDMAEGQISSIVSMGNPAVWWVSTICMVCCFYLFLKNKDKNLLFIIIGFLSQYAPWMLVTRAAFIYHFFGSVPFIILSAVYILRGFKLKYSNFKWVIFIYCGVVLFLFIMFYPVLSGMTISLDSAKTFLKWFPSWIFY